MRTDVLQALALCCHANAYLADRKADKAPELHGSNSTFRSVYEVAFTRKMTTLKTEESFEGTCAWLTRLKSDGVERLSLALEKCSFDPLKQHHEPWGILTDSGRGSEIWQPSWKVRKFGDKADATPWRVVYNADRFNRWSLRTQISAEEAESKLEDSVKMAREFCVSRGARSLAVPLDRSLELQRNGGVEMLGFPDLCPDLHPKEGRQLIASALRIMLITGSNIWSEAAFAEECHAEFSVNTQRMWHGAMLALETAAVIAPDQEELPTGPVFPHLEAS